MGVDVTAASPASGPVNSTPARRPGSVRRTSSVDMRWPGGAGTRLRLTGRARDLLTPKDGGAAVVLAEDGLRAGVHPATRTVEEIESEPVRPALAGLVGSPGDGYSRRRLAEVMSDERAAGTPLYLLLDDISGASLIAGFAFSQWIEPARILALRPGPARRMEGVCTGFMPGSGALLPDGTNRWDRDVRPVVPLGSGDDPLGWHALEDITEMSMRRARRIDVRADGGLIHVDSMFQDSATVPAGGRVAVHEYRLGATADLATGELRTLDADPRVLPYRECPLATLKMGDLLGVPMTCLRDEVLQRLKGVDGCTHLNDAVRALAEAPVLAAALGG